MTEPISVRDGDGSQWVRRSDGTYQLRKGNGQWDDRYQGYSLARIRDEFDGIRSALYEDKTGTETDYRYLSRR